MLIAVFMVCVFVGVVIPLPMRTCDKFEAMMVEEKKRKEDICTYTAYLHLYIT